MTRFWAEYAMLPTGLAASVTLDVDDGRFTAVTVDTPPLHGPAAGTEQLRGVVVPGFANCHSHAFHRALRGRTHADGGTFWTWREAMYAVAGRLTPQSYLALARATFAEMALAGVTSVGEFHYVHHHVDGTAYDEPGIMGTALRTAARDAGIRLTLLDTLYRSGGLNAQGHQPVSPQQLRFRDDDVASWAERVEAFEADDDARPGVAIHSVRAVPEQDFAAVRELADGTRSLHVHVSEQPAENEACAGFYGCSPTELLARNHLLGPSTTAVHATHLSAPDIALLGSSASTACFCPTTERDLADGIGPARALRDAGASLSLGSDQHAVIDLIEESRALESHERLASGTRGRFVPAELLAAATRHDTIGWRDVGVIEVGQRADLVSIDRSSIRTAGARPDQILYAATSSDVRTVIRDGEVIVRDGHHRLGDVARLLQLAIEPLWEGV